MSLLPSMMQTVRASSYLRYENDVREARWKGERKREREWELNIAKHNSNLYSAAVCKSCTTLDTNTKLEQEVWAVRKGIYPFPLGVDLVSSDAQKKCGIGQNKQCRYRIPNAQNNRMMLPLFLCPLVHLSVGWSGWLWQFRNFIFDKKLKGLQMKPCQNSQQMALKRKTGKTGNLAKQWQVEWKVTEIM